MPEVYETVKLHFDGRLASTGHIHLYEYSRSQYALARFVTTIERYRRTGEVIDRVTAGRTIDMVVAAPQRGSFDLAVLVPIVAEAGKQLQGVSFKALFSYVWAKLLPPNEQKQDLAVHLASIELERERERTAQGRSRDESETERLKTVRDIIHRQDATTSQLIDLLGRAISSPDQRLFRTGYDLSELARFEELARADLAREHEITSSEAMLARLKPEDIVRLSNRLRPMVGEIALPLRRSADRCSLGDASNDNAYVRLDEERVSQVTSRHIDDDEIVFKGMLRSYDRYTFRGKIETDVFPKTMHFSVELNNRERLKPIIVTAMGRREVRFVCATYKDVADNITSLILRDIEL